MGRTPIDPILSFAEGEGFELGVADGQRMFSFILKEDGLV
jgi:hypothetical protein